MKFTLVTWVWIVAVIVLRSRARPLPRRSLTSTLLLNALGFQPRGDGKVTISIQAFAHLATPESFSPLTHFLNSTLHQIHGDHMATAMQRFNLFGAVGIPFDKLTLTVKGCEEQDVELPRTGFKDLGIVIANVSVGKCQSSLPTAKTDNSDTVTIFSSPPTGLGIISDVDDTIKVTDVLEFQKMLENTAYKDPVPVAGMPDLYHSLAKSLTSYSIPPQFIYLSDSPFQLFPFLNSFLESHFPASLGPLLLQSLSATNPEEIFNFLFDKSGQKLDFKVEQIERIHGFYPHKSFLVIGDSSKQDPEVYGKAYIKFGSRFIRCIWIHLVDGADNSEERFEKAFRGVPDDTILKFSTSEIPRLQNIDVAGGKCK
ncbi:hypothetical protein J3R30DRAFT_2099468 [Lentinula aciculospora]|uniref:Phosphatidate phosphatase APP1 catalytic domain-containing protein n=1 Tax=Lentinula aciculospora TaxID=153920 RepID=A0A9W9AGA2_9AGAR|nr:hypothetical protein J3R30DRAFT_2099468 [Lentinula aciculospora]